MPICHETLSQSLPLLEDKVLSKGVQEDNSHPAKVPQLKGRTQLSWGSYPTEQMGECTLLPAPPHTYHLSHLPPHPSLQPLLSWADPSTSFMPFPFPQAPSQAPTHTPLSAYPLDSMNRAPDTHVNAESTGAQTPGRWARLWFGPATFPSPMKTSPLPYSSPHGLVGPPWRSHDLGLANQHIPFL